MTKKKKFGSFLAELRKRKNLTQDDIANYVKTGRNAISRLESGDYKGYNMDRICLIIDKLGYDSRNLRMYHLDEHEVEWHKKMESIRVHLDWQEIDNALPLIIKLENDKEFLKNVLNKQHLMLSQAIMLDYKDHTNPNVVKMLYDSIFLTSPKFQERYMSLFLLSSEEMLIINQLAINYFKNGNESKAISLLNDLKDNIDKNCFDEDFKDRFYVIIADNLSKFLLKKGEYLKVIDLCNEAIEFCVGSKFIYNLLSLSFTKIKCMVVNGKEKDCKKTVIELYHVAKFLKKETFAEEVRKYATDTGLVGKK